MSQGRMKPNRTSISLTHTRLSTHFLLAASASSACPKQTRAVSMKSWIRLSLAVALVTEAISSSAASIGASGDTNMPSTRIIYFVGDPINESVAFDPTSGPWLKDLWNNGGNIASGQNVLMTETLFNGGSA